MNEPKSVQFMCKCASLGTGVQPVLYLRVISDFLFVMVPLNHPGGILNI